ncbi:hypothetical protein [Acidisoma sp. C75]
MQLSDGMPARTVYADLRLNGTSVAGVLDAEVTLANHQVAGSFHVTLALGADPNFTAATFATAIDLYAEIRFGIGIPGLPAATATWASIITGSVDIIAYDLAAGTVQLSGRDLSAVFIDSLSAETFANNTASEIAQTLAARHGLTPVVTPTTGPVGRYYADGHALSSLHRSHSLVTEWDLLCGLAETEGFDVFVQNDSLFFTSPATDALPTVLTWMNPGSPGIALQTLHLERTLGLARDIVVTVQSWNSRQATMISETVRASPSGKAVVSTSPYAKQPATYVLIRPNLTSSEALTLANNTLSDLSRHQRVISAIMPGELSLAPRKPVVLAGSDTAFDQPYIIDEVVRHFSVRTGFTQTIRAVNLTN